jgi:hypothetical protein
LNWQKKASGGEGNVAKYARVTGKSGESVLPITATLPIGSTATPVTVSVPLAAPKGFEKISFGAGNG